MFVKIAAFFAAFVMLFVNLFSVQPTKIESGDVLIEKQPEENVLRTYDELNGAAGSKFYIERPSDKLNVVNASDFGMNADSDDNYEALKSALAYCKANSGTCLKIESGIYKVNNRQTFSLNGFKDVLIDGSGAVLVFSNVVSGFSISDSDCVEFRNIKFDWDWDKRPLSDIVTVKNADSKHNELDFVFRDREADENTIFSAITQCDPETFTYGAMNSAKENYIYQHPECIESVTKTDKNVLHVKHDGSFSKFKNGETYILRHYVYDVSFMLLSASQNVTFDGVSVYGYPGSGFVVNNKTSHFQIINSFIGANPEFAETRHTSLGADAIHIVNTNGCFNISGNDISGQGDDALNVHDGLGCVEEVSGNQIKLTASAMFINVGDTLGFRDDKFNATDFTAVVTEVKQLSYDSYVLTFDKSFEEIIDKNYIAYNTAYDSGNYIVSNNYIHENRARGLLLQSSDGICENNRFYKTEMQAIKVVMDISRGLWYEGKGVDRLVIRNNSFEMCDYIGLGEVITIGTNLDGKTAESQPFTNIEITQNTFKDFSKYAINANNVNGLVFAENTVEAGKEFPRKNGRGKAYFGRYCSNVTFENNSWSPKYKQTAKAETLEMWARINSQSL
ncbi:MAG: hypothetical protein MJ168_07585 [Clostridia bacterium]|nr:hypothetical protein [Clostridia bacterium]